MSELFRFCFPEVGIYRKIHIVLFVLCCCLYFMLIYFFSWKKAKEIEQKTQELQHQKEAFLSSHELVTSLSHDLRTPLTSLIGYLEISLNEKLCPSEKLPDYQRAVLQKAIQIKDFSDTLFEYFWVMNPQQELQTEKVYGNELVFQMAEEPLGDLEADRVTVERKMSDITCQLMLNTALIHRVFDNIFSNLRKYADFSEQVTAVYDMQDGFLMLSFANKKRKAISSGCRHKISLKSCQVIVQKHHGRLIIEGSVK